MKAHLQGIKATDKKIKNGILTCLDQNLVEEIMDTSYNKMATKFKYAHL